MKKIFENKLLFQIILCCLIFAQGCGFFISEDCPTHDYCDGNEFWTATGTTEFGCDNHLFEDCSATGRVCLTGRLHQEMGCYYEDTPCEDGVGLFCDGDIIVGCDEGWNLARNKFDCSESGLVCVQVSGHSARCTEACEEEKNECIQAADNLFMLKLEYDYDDNEDWISVSPDEDDMMQCIDGYWIIDAECTLPDTETDTDTNLDTDTNTDTNSDTIMGSDVSTDGDSTP